MAADFYDSLDAFVLLHARIHDGSITIAVKKGISARNPEASGMGVAQKQRFAANRCKGDYVGRASTIRTRPARMRLEINPVRAGSVARMSWHTRQVPSREPEES
jgi:hypothetical protein